MSGDEKIALITAKPAITDTDAGMHSYYSASATRSTVPMSAIIAHDDRAKYFINFIINAIFSSLTWCLHRESTNFY